MDLGATDAASDEAAAAAAVDAAVSAVDAASPRPEEGRDTRKRPKRRKHARSKEKGSASLAQSGLEVEQEKTGRERLAEQGSDASSATRRSSSCGVG